MILEASEQDALTGLYNRAGFLARLRIRLHQASQDSSTLALLMLNLRGFHRINHRFGQNAGDRVLNAVGEILKQVGRDGDLVARIGNDQFALLLGRVINTGHAELAALKILRLLEIPIQLPEARIHCSPVIGISLFPSRARCVDDLLRSAEQALIQAREQEQAIGLAASQSDAGNDSELDLELRLRDSIQRGELQVYYQPKLDLVSGQPIGAEALVRWQHPRLGLLPPARFLPIAEALGLMKSLTHWMLNSALRHSAEWTRQWGSLGVSVNVPAKVLDQPDFVDSVQSALRLWPGDDTRLCLEVLEESMVSEQSHACRNLAELRQQGVRIAIDDFGSGFSSLAYFRDLPADELKIDKSFIFGLHQDPANRHIVELIIELAHRFHLSVTAEGVEQDADLTLLAETGCDAVQGYLIARPMPATAFADWLLDFRPRPMPDPAPER